MLSHKSTFYTLLVLNVFLLPILSLIVWGIRRHSVQNFIFKNVPSSQEIIVCVKSIAAIPCQPKVYSDLIFKILSHLFILDRDGTLRLHYHYPYRRRRYDLLRWNTFFKKKSEHLVNISNAD